MTKLLLTAGELLTVFNAARCWGLGPDLEDRVFEIEEGGSSGLFWRGFGFAEQPALRVGGLYALAGDVEILGLYLDADKLAARADAGYAGRAAAHEGVEDQIAIA